MLSTLFKALFGCWHTNYSFPITMPAGARRGYAAVPTGTYVVCLDCGKELPYDWHEMKVLADSENRNHIPGLVAKEAR